MDALEGFATGGQSPNASKASSPVGSPKLDALATDWPQPMHATTAATALRCSMPGYPTLADFGWVIDGFTSASANEDTEPCKDVPAVADRRIGVHLMKRANSGRSLTAKLVKDPSVHGMPRSRTVRERQNQRRSIARILAADAHGSVDGLDVVTGEQLMEQAGHPDRHKTTAIIICTGRACHKPWMPPHPDSTSYIERAVACWPSALDVGHTCSDKTTPVSHCPLMRRAGLGILIDAIPESFVLGILSNSGDLPSLITFTLGVFLANFPEVRCSLAAPLDASTSWLTAHSCGHTGALFFGDHASVPHQDAHHTAHVGSRLAWNGCRRRVRGDCFPT